jgi:hypothetical protein
MKQHKIRTYLSTYLFNDALHQMRSLIRSTAVMKANTITISVKVKAHILAQKLITEV